MTTRCYGKCAGMFDLLGYWQTIFSSDHNIWFPPTPAIHECSLAFDILSHFLSAIFLWHIIRQLDRKWSSQGLELTPIRDGSVQAAALPTIPQCWPSVHIYTWVFTLHNHCLSGYLLGLLVRTHCQPFRAVPHRVGQSLCDLILLLVSLHYCLPLWVLHQYAVLSEEFKSAACWILINLGCCLGIQTLWLWLFF